MASIMDKAKNAVGMKTEDRTHTIVGGKIHDTGYGIMRLTWQSKPPSQEESFSCMRTALDMGANFWNGGEIYGNAERNSLHLLKEYFDKYPGDTNKVVISIKGGCNKDSLVPNGSADNVRRSIDECLTVMDNKKLDLFECARVDPKTPIEITVRAAEEYVKAGKLGGISLSECSANTIRRAAKVATISAVEVEFSIWETTIFDNGVAKACAELDIPIVAYSPLGRGFLTGQIKSANDIAEDDFRKHLPRFSEENFPKNLQLVEQLQQLADKKDCTTGQIGLAWVRAQSQRNGNPVIIPIPGASSVDRVKENFTEVKLSENDVKEIDSIIASVQVEGDRYGGPMAQLSFGDSAELNE